MLPHVPRSSSLTPVGETVLRFSDEEDTLNVDLFELNHKMQSRVRVIRGIHQRGLTPLNIFDREHQVGTYRRSPVGVDASNESLVYAPMLLREIEMRDFSLVTESFLTKCSGLPIFLVLC